MRDHARNPQAAADQSPKFERFRVSVLSIDVSMIGLPNQDPMGVAITMDDFRRQRKIGVSTVNGAGVYPKAGETWVIDRSLGTWTFAMRLVPHRPVVTDFVSLAIALHDLGLVDYSFRETTGSSTSNSSAGI